MNFYTDSSCQDFVAYADCNDFYEACSQFPSDVQVWSYAVQDSGDNCQNINDSTFLVWQLFGPDGCTDPNIVGGGCNSGDGCQQTISEGGDGAGPAQYFSCGLGITCIEC
jgi:hypothetical protein